MSKRRSLTVIDAGAGKPGKPSSRAPLWRSLEERAGTADVDPEREFPNGASEMDGVSRRGFMQVLGTATAFATVGAACRKPNEKIVPYVRRPEEVTPGNPLHFATSYAMEGYASGLLVESHEGRPTKIEGNPDHPETKGMSRVHEQAMILGLYDDDRAKQLRTGDEMLAWRTLLGRLAKESERLAANQGAGLRFLVDPSASPLVAGLRKRIVARFPKAKFVAYSGVASEGAVQGLRIAFGTAMVARHDLEKADVIVSLDADFLGEGPEQIRLTRQFSARRTPGATMNRLYAVEPAMTLTGAMADHRQRLRGGDVRAFAAALVAELAGQRGSLPALAPLSGVGAGSEPANWDKRFLSALAADLDKHRGRSLVIAGRRQPPAVHALAAALNVALGNEGATVAYGAPLTADADTGPTALGALAEDIAAGAVDTLVITASNPVYTAPADFKLGALLKRVPRTIYHTLYEDETAEVCQTIVPAAHALESWGDGRGTDGTVSIVQPLIHPLWGGIGESELLAAFIGEGDRGGHALLRQSWEASGGQGGTAFDSTWETWLRDGLVPGTTAAAPEKAPAIDGTALATAVRPLLANKTGGLEVAFVADAKVFDGRYANNAWLQELPDPITKLTWDNAILTSEATAKSLGVEHSQVIRLELRERAVTGPVMVVPGHADEAVTIALGYGRTRAGGTGTGVGFNAGLIRSSDAFWFERGGKVTAGENKYKFAITQDHWTMSPDGRDIRPPAVQGTLAEVTNEHSEFNEELEARRGPQPTIHTPVDYSPPKVQYKWGMSIDLSKCTGCSACAVACQSENNIPTVGKENVWRGREMVWIRIDRYFSGEAADPEMITQPLACVHCETAPCEYVCPVNATVHSDEGLNEMVYNRCIGTRYCSNNCPYKVRRFNFLNYTVDTPAARKLGMNPDVTVRTRGIMEKCTYCVQRIERKRIETRIENGGQGRAIRDGELKTACQQTCPADAIVFGSLNDPEARVTKEQEDKRRYNLLHEIGTRPRTTYLARVKNPNPELLVAAASAAESGAGHEQERAH